VFDRYSTASVQVIFSARVEAGNVGSAFIDTEHILLGLLRVDPTTLQLTAQPLSLHSVREYATRWHLPTEKLPSSMDLPINDDTKLVLDKAVSLADGHNCYFVRTEHLLLALTAITPSHAAAILQEVRISLERLEEIVAALPNTEQQEGNPSSMADLHPEL
jgi:ATP-dependent Clp protease ATP-binding subunit ClpC